MMNRDVNAQASASPTSGSSRVEATRRRSLPHTHSNLAIAALLLAVVVEGALWFRAEQLLRDATQTQAQVSAHDRLAAQQRMLAVADGEMSLEQARSDALGESAAPGWRATSAVARSRCAGAVAQRDAAYRNAGKQRDYDFIRYWDEYVYSACRAPGAS